MRYEPKDRLFHKAKEQGYRSRAAFKLQEIQKKHRLLRPGAWVLDLGSSPGAWSQVACELVGPKGRVIGIDLVDQKSDDKAPQKNLENFTFVLGDILAPETSTALEDILKGNSLDIVLSDLSHKLTGIQASDQERWYELAEAAFTLARRHLKAHGALVIKAFPGQRMAEWRKAMGRVFSENRQMTLDATRATSSEVYLVAMGFKKPD